MWRQFKIFFTSTRRRRRINYQINRYGSAASWLLKCRCIFFGRQPLRDIQKNFSVRESAPINKRIVRSHSKKRQSLKRLCLFGLRPVGSQIKLKGPSIWEYILYVSISIALIIAAGKYIMNLVPERAGLVKTKKTAIETYKQYSQRLDAISKKYANE